MLRISNLAGFGAGVAGLATANNILLESGDFLLLEDNVSKLRLETRLIDSFFSNVVLLFANGDGTDGNTDMVDQSDNSHALTYVGQAQMDTDIEKFSGKATLLLDGANDYISIPDHANFNLASQDFTFETWIYPTVVALQMIVSQYTATTTQRAWFFNIDESNNPNMFFSLDGTTSGALSITATGITITIDTWSYLVFQREGNNWTIWVAGNREEGPITQSFTVHNGTDVIRIGTRESAGINQEFEGNLGPSRLTVGIARYPGAPATIEVPNEPFTEG